MVVAYQTISNGNDFAWHIWLKIQRKREQSLQDQWLTFNFMPCHGQEGEHYRKYLKQGDYYIHLTM